MLEEQELFVSKDKPVIRLGTKLGVQFAVFVYIAASALQFFELLGNPSSRWERLKFDISWDNSFYFSVVTLLTVGYGDFVPYSTLGRLWVVCNIIFATYLVAREVGEIIDVLSTIRRGAGAYAKSEDTDHVVLTGKFHLDTLLLLLNEFYADSSNAQTQVVILSNQVQWTDSQWRAVMIANPLLRSRVTFLDGSAHRMHDLQRARTSNAKAVFVLAENAVWDPYQEDSNTLKQLLTLRAHAPRLQIYALSVLHDSSFLFQIAMDSEEIEDDTRDHRKISSRALSSYRSMLTSRETVSHAPDNSRSVCIQDFNMSLLAENVFCNGLSTLITNAMGKRPHPLDADEPWAVEYKTGLEFRIECVDLPGTLSGMKIFQIATLLYDYLIIVLAVQFPSESDWSIAYPNLELAENSRAMVYTCHDPLSLSRIIDRAANPVVVRRIRYEETRRTVQVW
uniref:Potassium channel domain-containing protein n=1 Tax=Compsopogon caeruleus TaxID=31354 RepID=A0A7S1XAN6_9RHOD